MDTDPTTQEVARTNRLDRPYEMFSRPSLGRIIDTPAKFLAFYRAWMQKHNLTPHANALPLIARVNWGRWLADCPTGDLDAPVIDPQWGVAVCLTCGSVFTSSIVMPPDWADIDAALMVRPLVHTRNWSPPETLADLLAENAAHGL